MGSLYLILGGARQDQWAWRVVDRRGRELARAKHRFDYYLDALADARASGFHDAPDFLSVDELPADLKARGDN